MRYRQIAALLVLLGAPTNCSSVDQGSGTSGKTITLQTKLAVADDLTQPMTNALGWSITLSKAYLSVGPLYYFAGDPVLSRHSASSSRQFEIANWVSGLLLKNAYAHPGHYVEGAAMGQMLEPTTVDLLHGSVDLADGNGVTGFTNSAKFTWQTPAQGALASALAGQVIWTRGIARKDAVTVRFIAKASGTEVVNGDEHVEVAGCAFGSAPGEVGVEMTGDGTVTLTLVPHVWFDQVDFAYAAPNAEAAPSPDAEGFVDIAGTLAWQGFVRGVKKGTAYAFAYRAQEQR
jgi:hypothetical protein